MEKINIAELLKQCPKGMELDCLMYDNMTLMEVDDKDAIYPIKLIRSDGWGIELTKYGQYVDMVDAKCVIFPKGKTTWEGFHRPFKDGDKITDKNKFIYRITEVTDKGYKLHDLKTSFITFEEANLYFVKVVDAFDITTLKPFDKVLVRDSDRDMWCASIFSHTWKDKYFCIDTWHKQCIPYEANKELLGTTNNPKEHGSN